MSVIPGAPALWVGVRPLRRGARRHLRRRPPRPVRRRQAPDQRRRAARGALRVAHRRGLRADGGVADRDVVGRRRRRCSDRSAGCSAGSSCASSTTRAATPSSVTPARSGCVGRTSSPATSTTPRRRPRVLTDDGWLRTGDIGDVRRGRPPVPRRPGQGPRHRVGLQRVPRRGRGRADDAPRRRRRRRHRRASPAHRRGGQGVRGAGAGALHRRGRAHRLLPRSPGPLQVPEQGPLRRRAAAHATGKLVRRDLAPVP